MKRVKRTDLIDLFLIVGIPFPCFFYYAIHFYQMFGPKNAVGQNICLIIIGAFVWGISDILWHYVSVLREHNQLKRFQTAFDGAVHKDLCKKFAGSIIGRRLEMILALKNTLSDIDHGILTDIISSRESGRALVAGYFIGACVLLGLFGSFLGLVETVGGVYSAIESIGSSDQLLSSLHRPLSGMSLTFGTSVVGIIASLSLGFSVIFLNRRQISFVADLEEFTQITLVPALGSSSRKKIDDVLGKLDNIQKNTALFGELRREIHDEAARSFSSVEDSYLKMTDSVQEKMQDAMLFTRDTVSGALTSLTASTSQTLSGLGTTVNASVEGIYDSFSNKMDTFLADERRSILEMLEKVKAYNRNGIESMGVMLADHGQAGRSQMDSFLSHMMRSNGELLDSLADQWNRLFEQDVRKTFNDVEENISLLHQDALKKNEDLFQQNMTLFSRTSQEFNLLGAGLRDMHESYSKRLDQTAQILRDIVAGFSQTVQQGHDTHGALLNRNDQICSQLEAISALIQGNQAEMQAAVSMFVQGVDNLLQSSQAMQQNEQVGKDFLEHLENALNGLTEQSGSVLLEYVARSREIYAGLLDNQLHLTREIKTLANRG